MTINLFNEEVSKKIMKFIEANKARISLNENLFDIYEGQIGPQLESKMKEDLGEKSYEHALSRKVPINVLKKIVDKLSKIYQQEPRREVIDGTESDAKLVAKLEEMLNIDHKLNIHNEFWNLYRYGLLQIGNDKGTPFIRTIPNHKYLIMNLSNIDPTTSDVVILFMDKETVDDVEVDIYWVFTDDQFVIYDSNGDIRKEMMVNLGQDGTIPFGEKPFVYLNASEQLAMPKVQSDTLDMTLLIPLLLSDTSYIAKYSTFSILYGIDVDDENMKRSPNVFWNFKSDTESDKNPEIGTIKPEGDIDQLLRLVMADLDIWLSTKGIKAGSVGNITIDNAVSGIAKMIDEGDVTDIRKFQASIYKRFEKVFWDLLLNKIYPFWKEQGLIEDMGTFSPNAKVVVNFAPQTPMQNRGDQVKTLSEEVAAGFNTRARAIKMLNPQMSDKEVEELVNEIDGEQEIVVMTDGKNEDDQE